MTFFLTEAEIDRVISRRRSYLIVGAGWMTLPFLLPKGCGFGLTGFMVLSLGIYAARLRRWRTEPGLWMLALFLTASLGWGFAYFETQRVIGLFEEDGGNLFQKRPTLADWGFAADACLALSRFGGIVSLTGSVARANWARTRSIPER